MALLLSPSLLPTRLTSCLLVGVFSLAHPSHAAAAQALECPASLQEKSLHVVDTPPGWSPFVGSPLYLHSAAPMSGPPEQLGELADYKETRRKDELIYTYQLDGKYPEGKWLACKYGESDQITLGRRMDDSVQSCTFTVRKGQHVGQNEVTIHCSQDLGNF